MKKIVLVILCCSIYFSISSDAHAIGGNKNRDNSKLKSDTGTCKIGGIEKNKEIDKLVDEYFNDWEDSEMVLQLPDGGYIRGSLEPFNSLDKEGNVIEVYSIATDSNSKTVAEAKTEMKNELRVEIPSISLFGANPPPITTPIYTLPLNGEYKSNFFNAIGWRYGEQRFYPATGTGDYLRWSTYGDDGRVGILPALGFPAGFVFNPNWHTQPLYRGEYKYIKAEQSPAYCCATQFYATYSPVQGTYYLVENK